MFWNWCSIINNNVYLLINCLDRMFNVWLLIKCLINNYHFWSLTIMFNHSLKWSNMLLDHWLKLLVSPTIPTPLRDLRIECENEMTIRSKFTLRLRSCTMYTLQACKLPKHSKPSKSFMNMRGLWCAKPPMNQFWMIFLITHSMTKEI